MVKKLETLVRLHKILPISSTARERGFSPMNLHQTKIRNRLLVKTVNQLLKISINSPSMAFWNVTKNVISWLKLSHHGAQDKAGNKC